MSEIKKGEVNGLELVDKISYLEQVIKEIESLPKSDVKYRVSRLNRYKRQLKILRRLAHE